MPILLASALLLADLTLKGGPVTLPVPPPPSGSIYGTVMARSKRPLGGATVVVVDPLHDVNHRAMTDASGRYLVPHLVENRYRIWVKAPGHGQYVRRNIALHTGQHLRMNIVFAH